MERIYKLVDEVLDQFPSLSGDDRHQFREYLVRAIALDYAQRHQELAARVEGVSNELIAVVAIFRMNAKAALSPQFGESGAASVSEEAEPS